MSIDFVFMRLRGYRIVSFKILNFDMSELILKKVHHGCSYLYQSKRLIA